MTEGKIVSWVKSEGDRLSKGESVVVVESDKADMDVETFYDGILAAIVVPAGESALVGAPIGLLAESEEEVALAKAQAHSQSQSQPQPQAQSPPPVSPPSPPASAAVTTLAVSEGPRKTLATPYAKKLAKQHKVDIGSVTGTGPYGRITPSDIDTAAGIQPKKPESSPTEFPVPQVPSPSAGATAKAPTAVLPPIPGSTVVPFTTMQAAVSKNMVESLSVPTFRVGYTVTTNALDSLYEKVYIYFVLLASWRYFFSHQYDAFALSFELVPSLDIESSSTNLIFIRSKQLFNDIITVDFENSIPLAPLTLDKFRTGNLYC